MSERLIEYSNINDRNVFSELEVKLPNHVQPVYDYLSTNRLLFVDFGTLEVLYLEYSLAKKNSTNLSNDDIIPKGVLHSQNDQSSLSKKKTQITRWAKMVFRNINNSDALKVNKLKYILETGSRGNNISYRLLKCN
jgi:hypothetical protein